MNQLRNLSYQKFFKMSHGVRDRGRQSGCKFLFFTTKSETLITLRWKIQSQPNFLWLIMGSCWRRLYCRKQYILKTAPPGGGRKYKKKKTVTTLPILVQSEPNLLGLLIVWPWTNLCENISSQNQRPLVKVDGPKTLLHPLKLVVLRSTFNVHARNLVHVFLRSGRSKKSA